MSVTQQCCKGFGRKKNSKSANIFMPCEELHLRSLIETSERLNGREFIRSAQKNDIDDELRKNITLFLPTDATFTEFAEQLLESVCLLFEFASFFVASVYFASISNVLTFVYEFSRIWLFYLDQDLADKRKPLASQPNRSS